MQITTKYKIRTKYNENVRPISIMKVRRQHVCNKNQYTEGHKEREKERERERELVVNNG
jgi:hypothetical protein